MKRYKCPECGKRNYLRTAPPYARVQSFNCNSCGHVYSYEHGVVVGSDEHSAIKERAFKIIQKPREKTTKLTLLTGLSSGKEKRE